MDEQLLEDSSNYFPVEYDEEATVPKRQRFSRPKVCDASFWSNDNTKKLISAIKLQTAIWQTESEGFKSRVQREEAWQKVAENFDSEIIDTNQLVAKWQNLRTQYRSVRAAARKNAFKKPAWRFYTEMLFIDNGEMIENNEANITSSITEQVATSSVANPNLKQLYIRNVDTKFWSDQNILKLIKAVKNRKSIWCLDDKNYKQRSTRESDWQSIADEFEGKITVNQLVAKWLNLRKSYRLAKDTKQQGTNNKYFAYMTFLDENEEEQKIGIHVTDEVEELEDIESIAAAESYVCDDINSEVIVHSDYEENVAKEQHIEEYIERVNDPLIKTEPDNIEMFGNFLVSELRKIKNEAYLETTKRRLLQFLWQCIDEEPAKI